jgi:hypothetical protein
MDFTSSHTVNDPANTSATKCRAKNLEQVFTRLTNQQSHFGWRNIRLDLQCGGIDELLMSPHSILYDWTCDRSPVTLCLIHAKTFSPRSQVKAWTAVVSIFAVKNSRRCKRSWIDHYQEWLDPSGRVKTFERCMKRSRERKYVLHPLLRKLRTILRAKIYHLKVESKSTSLIRCRIGETNHFF